MKYKVIQKDGQIVKLKDYFKAGKGSASFRAFLKVEALKRSVIPDSAVENKKPKYLKIARELGFNWEKNSDFGFLNYDYKANLIVRLVKAYARQLVHQIGFPIYEVKGANIFDLAHPVVSAYASLYGDRLFQFRSGKKEVVMSYDASYPQFNLAGKYQLSYKNLPFAHFSISDCYRHEQSGECMLLYRLRRFFMADLHPYFENLNQAFFWYPKIEKQLIKAGQEANRNYQVVVEVSSWQNWEKYKQEIVKIGQNLNQDILVGILIDQANRYWIINVDYKIIDQLGQPREICCIQVDLGNAKRLGIEYVNHKGQIQNPVIIHSAVPSGIERFIFMLIDRFKQSFPLWLYPAQIRLIPVNQNFVAFCQSLVEKNRSLPVRIEIDDRTESVSKKIKLAHQNLIPFPIVIGKKEKRNKKIAKLEAAINQVIESAKNKPFVKLNYPNLLSIQVS